MPNSPALPARAGRAAAAVPYLLAALPLALAAASLTVLVLPLWACAVAVGVVSTLPGRRDGRPAGRAADPGLWLAPALLIARAAGSAERALTASLAAVRVGCPYLPAPPGAGRRSRTTDPAAWREVAYVLVAGPVLGAGWLFAAVHLIAPPVALALGTVWYRQSEHKPVHAGLWQFELPSSGWALLACLSAPLLAVPALALLRGAALARARTVRVLLGPTAETRRAAEQEAARAAAVRTHLADHRRIERDLHDGAQARMVAVSMSLGRARRKFAADPAAARMLLDQAYEESRRALADLRAVVRGMHPPVLADRGLDAAVSSLAAAVGIPVNVSVDLPQRPAAPVESAAYFVIAECLANVAKHADAGSAHVRVHHRGGRLVVRVDDDGAGGATPSAGGGLAGLADRVRAVGGRLTVHSPPGGPTTVRAELPCGW